MKTKIEWAYGIIKYGKVKSRHTKRSEADVRAAAEKLKAEIGLLGDLPRYFNAHVYIDTREVTEWTRELLS